MLKQNMMLYDVCRVLTTRRQLPPTLTWKRELNYGVKYSVVELIHCQWIQVINSLFGYIRFVLKSPILPKILPLL